MGTPRRLETTSILTTIEDVLKLSPQAVPLDTPQAAALVFELPRERSDLRALAIPFLSEPERRRLTALSDPEKQDSFLFARAAVRVSLGAILGPNPWTIAAETGRKPRLTSRELDFNLSHSGRWIALGFTLAGQIGVDIEAARETPKALDLARRFFDPEEARLLATLAPADLSRGFLRFWTAKEALLKARDGAVPTDLPKLRLRMAPDRALTPLETGWRLIEIAHEPGLVGFVSLGN